MEEFWPNYIYLLYYDTFIIELEIPADCFASYQYLVDDIRINYDSFGETLTVDIMPNVHPWSYQSWIIRAIMADMFGSGFITAAEYAALAIESSRHTTPTKTSPKAHATWSNKVEHYQNYPRQLGWLLGTLLGSNIFQVTARCYWEYGFTPPPLPLKRWCPKATAFRASPGLQVSLWRRRAYDHQGPKYHRQSNSRPS